MYILNGRCHDDKDLDKFTCKNASVVDYVICTDELFNRIADFYVDEFDPLLSDIRCPRVFKISTQVHIDTNKKPHEQDCSTNHDTCEERTSEHTYNKWNSENKTLFNQFFDTERFNNTLQLLEDIKHKVNIQQKDVNDITKIYQTSSHKPQTTLACCDSVNLTTNNPLGDVEKHTNHGITQNVRQNDTDTI